MCRKLCFLISFVLLLGLAGDTLADLVGWWGFDEGSDNTAYDYSSGGNDGTITGSATWVAGRVGGALSFDFDGFGLDGSVSLPSDTLSSISTQVTVAFWQYGAPTQPARACYPFQAATANSSIVLRVYLPRNDERVYFDAGTGDYDRTFTEVLDANQYRGQWNHWVFTKNSVNGYQNIYLNGELLDNSTGNYKPMNNINKFVIGSRYDGSSAYQGLIDEFRVYDHAMTAAEVADLYANAGLRARNPNPPRFAEDVELNVVISWTASDDANSHDVYFGTSFNDVNDANNLWEVGTSVYKGRQALETNSYDPCGLEFGTTYYWRIDEVNDANMWKGDIWSFITTPDPNSFFAFTVTADSRGNRAEFQHVLSEITDKVGDEGVFHISPGDIDPPSDNYNDLISEFGSDVVWYPIVGNHEIDNPPGNPDVVWIRDEYNYGHNAARDPLKDYTNQNGPAGSVETTYSWDYRNAHFIALNEYWDGGTAPGSDMATDGDIVDELYDWLVDDLTNNTKAVIFVFGHEPAYPENRHIGNSLDQYPSNRDRFWKLLNDMEVAAYFCGHTHTYYRRQVGSFNWEPFTWQVDVGNAGNEHGGNAYQTFVNVTVSDSGEVQFDIWQGTESDDFEMTDSWTELLPVEAVMQFTPQALNPNSKGKWVKAHLVLPEGFLPEDVNVNEPAVAKLMETETESYHINVFIN
ncbi:MAG: LamG-like jellyroll fold domain-containing protein, partial [Planctomycetota bacterium]